MNSSLFIPIKRRNLNAIALNLITVHIAVRIIHSAFFVYNIFTINKKITAHEHQNTNIALARIFVTFLFKATAAVTKALPSTIS